MRGLRQEMRLKTEKAPLVFSQSCWPRCQYTISKTHAVALPAVGLNAVVLVRVA
jgi:hypothetical protein